MCSGRGRGEGVPFAHSPLKGTCLGAGIKWRPGCIAVIPRGVAQRAIQLLPYMPVHSDLLAVYPTLIYSPTLLTGEFPHSE